MASIEQTRAIVEPNETYDGKIIPTAQAEIGRPVTVKSGATVKGSIYGESISIQGGTVDGSVMGAESIELDGSEVGGEIGSDGRVVGSESTIYGTVTGTTIRLTDCIVYGNVVGTNIILENCVVMGIATGEQRFAAENSLCYTFKTYGEAKLDNLSVVLPQAIVEGKVSFESSVVVTGLGELDTGSSAFPTMNETDLIERHGTTHLTLSPRILNIEAVTDRLDELEETLKRVVTATSRAEVPPAAELLDTLGVAESQYPDVL